MNIVRSLSEPITIEEALETLTPAYEVVEFLNIEPWTTNPISLCELTIKICIDFFLEIPKGSRRFGYKSQTLDDCLSRLVAFAMILWVFNNRNNENSELISSEELSEALLPVFDIVNIINHKWAEEAQTAVALCKIHITIGMRDYKKANQVKKKKLLRMIVGNIILLWVCNHRITNNSIDLLN